MITVNINEAKAKLSEYLDAAVKGERVLICRHNRPVAELRAVEHAVAEPRDLTPIYPGAAFTTAAFFEPLPKEELDAWEGLARGRHLTAAEQHASYSPTPRPRRRRVRR